MAENESSFQPSLAFPLEMISPAVVIGYWGAIFLFIGVQKTCFVESYIKGYGLTAEEEAHHLNDPLILWLHWWEGIQCLTVGGLLLAAGRAGRTSPSNQSAIVLSMQRKAIQYGVLPSTVLVSYGAYGIARDGLVPSYSVSAPLWTMCAIGFFGGLLACYEPTLPRGDLRGKEK